MNTKQARTWSAVSGLTLLELIGVILILGLLVVLLIPNMRVSREAARRMSCSNNFKQIGLALHNYHSAYKCLPPAMGGTSSAEPGTSNAGRLSGLVPLLPFMEQQALWEQVVEVDAYPSMGPEPWVSAYEPWSQQIPSYQCPSAPSPSTDLGITTYAFCIGDAAEKIHQPDHVRGVFACGVTTRFKEVLDGLANTIAMGEIGSMFDRDVRGQFAVDQALSILTEPASVDSLYSGRKFNRAVQLSEFGRGGRWADGSAGSGLVQTILPPNSPSVAVGGKEAVDGLYSVGSFHEGGAHVLMTDGAVIFITESIDAGDPHHRPPTLADLQDGNVASPYGLWGALGTAAAAETIEESINQ